MNVPMINIQEAYELVKLGDFDVDDAELVQGKLPFSSFVLFYKENNMTIQTYVRGSPETRETIFRTALALPGRQPKSFADVSLSYDLQANGKGKYMVYGADEKLASLGKDQQTRFADSAAREAKNCAFAILLMSCKNITYEDYDPMKHISRQQLRDRERKGKRPFLKYQILHIKPFKARTIERRPESESKRHVAAHRTRGHFKTFTPEHPAFGKPWGVGTFYVFDFVSGDLNLGLNVNDYHIELEVSDGRPDDDPGC